MPTPCSPNAVNALEGKNDMPKYRIMHDHGAYEGYRLDEKEFDDVSEAVNYAMNLGYSVPFVIIQIIEWKATEVNPE